MNRTTLRLVILMGALALVLGFYTLRLVKMQIVEGEAYQALANSSYVRLQEEPAARGEIVDRYGRPLAVNRVGYNITFDRAFLPQGEENEVILRLTEIMEGTEDEWIDRLPITLQEPFAYLEGYEGQVTRLKNRLGLGEYATAQDAMHWLTDRYGLEDYTPEEARKIAAVRYEMEQQGFNLSTPYTFAEDVQSSTMIKVEERGFELPGVGATQSAVREYVEPDLAPHLIGQIGPIYAEELEQLQDEGYSGTDLIGKSGIEQAYEEELRGTDGTRQITVSSTGDILDITTTKEPIPGNTIMLTIDRDLQRVAQEALKAQIKNLQATAAEGRGKEADSGAVVAIEVATGDVLACATYPSYSLDTYNQDYSQLASDPLRPLWNRALYGTYRPGSIFKPNVAVAALTEGVITPDTIVNCTRIYTYYDDYQPSCLYYNGPINVVGALQVSCNYFFYDVGRQLGIDKIAEYATRFGLGQPTGIELPEETGHAATPELKLELTGEEWVPGDTLQAAIGQQENQFTPLQLANYTATLANNGTRMKVNLVRAIKSADFEETIYDRVPQVVEQIDSPDAFETVRQGMILASLPGGTSSATFGDYPISVASKTGTPETSAVMVNSTYICYAPAEDPVIAVAVVIEKGWQGYTGAPVAKAIFDEYFFSENDYAAASAQGVVEP